MEIYQSKKTAAEMEYALSAIPSIGANNHWFIGDQDTGVLAEGLTPYVGANGNWWVGETDTGIFAGGVKVEGAQVGQTIVIKAVDENGMPTEWEASDLTKGMRHIATISVEEDVRVAFIDSDKDGQPFELEELVINAYIVPATKNPGTAWLKVFINDNTVIFDGNLVPSVGSSKSVSMYIKGDGNLFWPVYSVINSATAFDANMKLTANYTTIGSPTLAKCGPFKKITAIRLGTDNNTNIIGVGTKFAIWGR